MTSPPHTPRQATGVVCSEVLDELVVYNPETSNAISLNASARAIWNLCDGTRTLEDIGIEMSEIFDGSPEQLRSDVQSVFVQLQALGFLTVDMT